jgi:uncharacterized protein YkwD
LYVNDNHDEIKNKSHLVQEDYCLMSKKSIKDSAPKTNIISMELQVHTLTNKQRHAYGLNLLKFDPALSVIARDHSIDMQKNNFFSHTNLSGEGPTERAKRKGHTFRKKVGNYQLVGIAENISQNFIYESITYLNGIPHYRWKSVDDIVRSTVKGWMQSPGHRKNILTPTYQTDGIGVAIADDGKVYITQNFF